MPYTKKQNPNINRHFNFALDVTDIASVMVNK